MLGGEANDAKSEAWQPEANGIHQVPCNNSALGTRTSLTRQFPDHNAQHARACPPPHGKARLPPPRPPEASAPLSA